MYTSATPERTPHSGIQTWSRGPLFPAVVAVVETYTSPMTHAEWAAVNTQLAHHDQAERFYRSYVARFLVQPVADRLTSTMYRLTMPGRDDQMHTSSGNAEEVARNLLEYDAKVVAYRASRAEIIDRANARMSAALGEWAA